MLKLLCWIFGEDVRMIFPVELPRTGTVAELKVVVKNAVTELHGVDARRLQLYSLPYHGDARAELEKWDSVKNDPLEPLTRLSQLFPEYDETTQLIIVSPPIPDELTLNCLVHGDEIERIFGVEISSTKSVTTLKRVIKESRKMDTSDLDLHVVSLPCYKDLALALAGLKFEAPLPAWKTVSSVFSTIPLPEHLHIVVKVPISRDSKGKKRVQPEATAEAIKRAKLATVSPPNLALPQNFKKWTGETRDTEFVDHRYLLNTSPSFDDLPPISLQYEGFGHFLDIYYGRTNVPGIENVPNPGFWSAVDNFAEMMSHRYDDEHDRRTYGLLALNDVFSADKHTRELSATNVSKRATADGLVRGPHRAAYCVVEFKNEMANITSIPYVELAGYFAHSFHEAIQDPVASQIIDGWNVPCLGITVIGHYITFYAMIYFGQWRIVSLTPALSCIRAASDGKERVALYNAFRAASVLLACIDEDAVKLVQEVPPPIEHESRILALKSNLLCPDSDARITFNIYERTPSRGLYRYIYLATTDDDAQKMIIVKFTTSYSLKLHMFCASRGHAPALLGFERLPGGFYAVAMECVVAHEVSRSPYIAKHETWKAQLVSLVKSFHSEGLVHGDLRSPNILCDENRVMLIDFDWAGEEGEASYPQVKLTPELTDGRTRTDLKITKDDDLRVLEKTLKIFRDSDH